MATAKHPSCMDPAAAAARAAYLAPAPPALSQHYDALGHVAAAEALSNMCRQIRLDELESSAGAELCALLSTIARCADAPFSGMAIEAIGAR